MTGDNMRTLMNLMEQQVTESEPMTGSPNGTALMQLLSEITDKNLFASAMSKIRAGRTESLSPNEYRQLGLAFVSLVHLQPIDRNKFLQTIRTFVERPQQQAQPSPAVPQQPQTPVQNANPNPAPTSGTPQ